MSHRAIALFAFAFLELLAGIILRNEALAARGRAETQVRRELTCERRERETRNLYAMLAAQAAVEQRARHKPARTKPVVGAQPIL